MQKESSLRKQPVTFRTLLSFPGLDFFPGAVGRPCLSKRQMQSPEPSYRPPPLPRLPWRKVGLPQPQLVPRAKLCLLSREHILGQCSVVSLDLSSVSSAI